MTVAPGMQSTADALATWYVFLSAPAVLMGKISRVLEAKTILSMPEYHTLSEGDL